MRTLLSAAAALLALTPAGPTLATPVEDQVCADLKAQNRVGWTTNHILFHRNEKRELVQVDSGSGVSRRGAFYYYVQAPENAPGARSLINVKSVYKGSRNPSARRFVDLRSNRWDDYDDTRRARVENICARLTPEGYERFHLHNSRSYCLSRFFHQRAPDFDTLATIRRRESFAFQDMLGEPSGNPIVAFFSSLGPRPAAANERTVSTAPFSHIRSWIVNFTYNGAADRCIEVNPNIPEDAESVHMRIDYHGTSTRDGVVSRSWQLTFSK